jgi:hypothetical protein
MLAANTRKGRLITAVFVASETTTDGAAAPPTAKAPGGTMPPERRGTTTATGAGIHVAEATASHLYLAELMAVQKERFIPAQRPILAPLPVEPAPFEQHSGRHGRHSTAI